MQTTSGQGVNRPTVAFIGWFGPRSLALLVFALLALERGVPEGEVVLTTVVVTVALSVILHGRDQQLTNCQPATRAQGCGSDPGGVSSVG